MSAEDVRERLEKADELRNRVRALESLQDSLRNPYIAPDLHWYDGLLWWKHDKRQGAEPRQEITRDEAYELRAMIPDLIRRKREEYEELEASVTVTDEPAPVRASPPPAPTPPPLRRAPR